MSKIIIGIHGLGNKPPGSVLKKWWKQSIGEGLRTIGHTRLLFNFELVYWAGYLHEEPLNPDEKNPHDPHYEDEPYVHSKGYVKKEPSIFRKKILDYIEKQMDRIFLNEDMSINYSFVTDFIIHHFFRDLDIYYYSDCVLKCKSDLTAKKIIRDYMASILEKHRGKEILLIAHSMGSIIAYDVLTLSVPDIKIDTFVTIGSPLGLPVVMGKIAQEQKAHGKRVRHVRTPENIVRNWYNFSDLKDKITFNYNLGDDYGKNSHHIQPVDREVYNDYEYNGKKNPHKSYGYLRTPELAEVINDFLNRDRSRTMIWLDEKINNLMSRFLSL